MADHTMLRTPNDIIAALRSRKEQLQLSDATVDEIAGLTSGHCGKVLGPTREKAPTLFTLMTLVGALGLAVQLVPDPETQVQGRWQKRLTPPRVGGNGRLSRLRRARADAVAELASKGGRSRWADKTPEQRQAYVAMLNAARAGKRQAGMSEAASHRHMAAPARAPADTALAVFEAWATLRGPAPCPAAAKAALIEQIICP
jgi:hypothetical protein